MSLKHAALGLLSRGPASGYDMLRNFHDLLASVWPATQSQLYGELNKLAESGLAEVVSEGARGRKEYALTEAGMAELKHWITEVEPTKVRRSELLLRVFFLSVVEPEQAEQFLRRQAEQATQYHEELVAVKDRTADAGELSNYGLLILEWGLRLTDMHRDWVNWALEHLDKSTE